MWQLRPLGQSALVSQGLPNFSSGLPALPLLPALLPIAPPVLGAPLWLLLPPDEIRPPSPSGMRFGSTSTMPMLGPTGPEFCGSSLLQAGSASQTPKSAAA
jgi:hypothetical protein